MPLVGSQLAVTVLTSVTVNHMSVSAVVNLWRMVCLFVCVCVCVCVCVLGSRLVRVMVWLGSSISTLRLTALYCKPLMNFCLTLH